MFERARYLSDEERRDMVGNLLLFAMFGLEVVYLYSASPVVLVPCGMLGVAAFVYARKNDGSLLPLMACIAAGAVVLVSINRILVLNCSWSGCLRIVFVSLPMACLLCSVRVHRRAAIAFFYATLIYTTAMVALADPAELYRIFAASSRSYISVLLIACMFPYYVACEREHTEVSVIPALATFAVSAYVQGRGGIVASGTLLALTCVRRAYLRMATRSAASGRRLAFVLLAAALLLVAAIAAFGGSFPYLSRFFEVESYSITRADMWKEYVTVAGSSVRNVIFGPPLTTCPLILAESYNSHNSYLMVHSYMGIVGFVAVVLGGIGYLVLCARRRAYNLLFLSVAFLLRATTDYLFPMLFCDCIVLFMVMQTGVEVMRAINER